MAAMHQFLDRNKNGDFLLQVAETLRKHKWVQYFGWENWWREYYCKEYHEHEPGKQPCQAWAARFPEEDEDEEILDELSDRQEDDQEAMVEDEEDEASSEIKDESD